MRRGLIASLVAVLLFVTPSSAAFGDVGVACEREGANTECMASVDALGAEGSTEAGSSGGERVCHDSTGARISCVMDGRFWHEPTQCYLGRAEPQPPKSHPIWQDRQEGVIYSCALGSSGTGLGSPESYVWMASPPDRIDPAVLAQQAVDSMNLTPIRVATSPRALEVNPKSVATIGWHVWLWAKQPDATTWGPNTATASADGVTVTATAKAQKVVWDMGDDTTETCRGPGEKWNHATARWRAPSCGHLYTRKGEYPVTATSHWHVDWEGGGQTGVIEFTLTAPTIHMAVQEIHTLITG